MKVKSILSAGGNAYKESRFSHDASKHSCFIEAFYEGVIFYANHLYDKGSLFAILQSLRFTTDSQEWSPVMDYEQTILRVLREYKMNYTDITNLKEIIKQKDEQIKELEHALSTLH